MEKWTLYGGSLLPAIWVYLKIDRTIKIRDSAGPLIVAGVPALAVMIVSSILLSRFMEKKINLPDTRTRFIRTAIAAFCVFFGYLVLLAEALP